MDSGRGFMEEIPEDFYNKAVKKYDEEPFRNPYEVKSVLKPMQERKSGVFRIGEELEIKGAWFKVKKINSFGIMLKSIKSKPSS